MRSNVRAAWRYSLRAVALTLTTAGTAGAECLVQGESVSLQRVEVPGLPLTTVDLDRVRVAATVPERTSAPSRLYVRGTVAFTGSRKGLWFRVTSIADAGAGMVRAVRRPAFVHARASGDAVIGSLVMETGDVTPGREGEPEEFVRNVRLPCSSLSLDAAGPDAGGPDPEGDGSFWRPRWEGASVVFRAEPRSNAATLVLDGPNVRASGTFQLERVSTARTWTQVLRRGEGATILGWIRTAELVRLPQQIISPGCCSIYESTLRTRHYQGPNPITYSGEGEIPPGTPIYDGRGTNLWAVVDGSGVFRIEQRAGESWARLAAIPGVVGGAGYVATSSVFFPPGKAPP